jgi:hypothetical protein
MWTSAVSQKGDALPNKQHSGEDAQAEGPTQGQVLLSSARTALFQCVRCNLYPLWSHLGRNIRLIAHLEKRGCRAGETVSGVKQFDDCLDEPYIVSSVLDSSTAIFLA